MNNKILLGVAMLLLLPLASAHNTGSSVYDGYYRYYNPSHTGFYEGHDYTRDRPQIIYEYGDRETNHYNPYYVPNDYKLDFFRSIGYYDPDRFTEEQFERCHYYGDCPREDEDDDRHHDFRREALSVQRGSYEYFKAGYRAQANQEIAFKKGFNDGYYGKKAYFDDDHEHTTWYREAYLDGWHSGLEDRHRYDRPG